MTTRTLLAFAALLIALALIRSAQTFAQENRPRARDLGIHPGIHPTGPNNAITDVAGVEVGQVTLIKGDNVRTGVTAILPHAGNIFQDKVAGAVSVYNAFGKLLGSTQITELGQIETPIVLTNTLSACGSGGCQLDLGSARKPGRIERQSRRRGNQRRLAQ